MTPFKPSLLLCDECIDAWQIRDALPPSLQLSLFGEADHG